MAKGADETMLVFEVREQRIERVGVKRKKEETDAACR